ncbi:MAG: hypothetical protein IPP17_00145 [Bacteroidetes bacterium]|nr:hypothetical protein [Bacteroidota bacterium]
MKHTEEFEEVFSTDSKTEAFAALNLLVKNAVTAAISQVDVSEDNPTILYLVICPSDQADRAIFLLQQALEDELSGIEHAVFDRLDIVASMDDDELLRTLVELIEEDPELAQACKEELQNRNKLPVASVVEMLQFKFRSQPKVAELPWFTRPVLLVACIALPPLGLLMALDIVTAKSVAPDGSRHPGYAANVRQTAGVGILLSLISTSILVYITMKGY